MATVACSWPWGSQLDHTETREPLRAYQPSPLRAACLLLSGPMVLPDPSFLKVL